ncbi:hypothetical protein P4U97_03905 [Bacillus swezeyi]|uniref:hypothetical protein n=1 Tax=Bacillus swezeyi TaxID=1925020 RepID=UPI002E2420C2|nr:hypothetical protein [Bacillus swezeyi]
MALWLYREIIPKNSEAFLMEDLYDANWLNEDNRFITDQNGAIFPAVYPDWRW